MQRNSHYWNDTNNYFDEVIYHVLDVTAEVTRYRAGDLDITANVDAFQVEELRRKRSEELKISPALSVYYYGFNLSKDWIGGNRKLRQALTMAIDREVIVEKITRRGEAPAYSWVPPKVSNYSGYQMAFAKLSRAERERRARRLFAEAGYDESNRS